MKRWYRYQLLGVFCLLSQCIYSADPGIEVHNDSFDLGIDDRDPLAKPLPEGRGNLLHLSEPGLHHPPVSLPLDLPIHVEPHQQEGGSVLGGETLEHSSVQDPTSSTQLKGISTALGSVAVVGGGNHPTVSLSDVVLSPELQTLQTRLEKEIQAFHELVKSFEKIPPSTSTARKALLSKITRISADLNKIEKQLDSVSGDKEEKQELLVVIRGMYDQARSFSSKVKASGAKEEDGVAKPDKGGKAVLPLAPLPPDILRDVYPVQSEVALLPGEEQGEQISGCFRGQEGPNGFPKGLAVSRGGILKAIGELEQLVVSGEGKIKANKEAAKKDAEEGTKTVLQVLSSDEALAVELFHLNVDEELALTALASNSAVALSPKIIGQMVRMIESGQLATLVTSTGDDEGFLKTWHDYYTEIPLALADEAKGVKPLTEFAKFKKSARFFLRVLNECARTEKQRAIDLLLANLDQKVQSVSSSAGQIEMIDEYKKALELSYELKLAPYYVGDRKSLVAWYGKEKFTLATIESEVENLTFLAQALFRDPDIERIYQTSVNYSLEFEGDVFPACHEGVVETVLRLIFYDSVSKTLDLSKVPQAIQDSMSPALKEYIKTYGKLGKVDRATAKKALLAIIENIPGVKYYRTSPTGVRYELDGSTQNTANLLKALFGIRDDQVTGKRAEELKSIFGLLSTPDHTLALEFLENDQTPYSDGHPADRDIFALTLQTPDFVVQAEASLDAEHGETSFPALTTVEYTHELIRNLWLAGKVTDQFLLGGCDILAGSLIDSLLFTESLKTKDDFLFFFNKYSSAFDRAFTRPFTAEQVYNRVVSVLFSHPIEVRFEESFKNLFEALKELGLDINQKIPNEAGGSTTFLLLAVSLNDPLLFNILLESGAEISEKEVGTLMEIFAQSRHQWSARQQQTVIATLYAVGKIPLTSEFLTMALAKNCGMLVKFLVDHGVIPTADQIQSMEKLAPGWTPEIALGILSELVAKGIPVKHPDTFILTAAGSVSASALLEAIGKYNCTNLLQLAARQTMRYTTSIEFFQEGKIRTMTLLEALYEHGDSDFIRQHMGDVISSLRHCGLAEQTEALGLLEKVGISRSDILKTIYIQNDFKVLEAVSDPRQALALLKELPGFSLDAQYGWDRRTLLDYVIEYSNFPYIEVFLEAGISVNNGQARDLIRFLNRKHQTLSVATQAHLLKLLLVAGIKHETINNYIKHYPSVGLAWEMVQNSDENKDASLTAVGKKELSAARDRVDGLVA